MKFIKEWSNWNPILNKDVLDFIEINKISLRCLWNDSKSEEDNIKFLIDYFTKYPDEMKSSIDIDKVKMSLSKSTLRNSAPSLQNLGGSSDFRSF